MRRKFFLLVALVAVFLASWSAPGSQACEFCNVTGYPVCQTKDGTACSVPGASRRCIVSPQCYCEWGVCLCDGATGTWNCFW